MWRGLKGLNCDLLMPYRHQNTSPDRHLDKDAILDAAR